MGVCVIEDDFGEGEEGCLKSSIDGVIDGLSLSNCGSGIAYRVLFGVYEAHGVGRERVLGEFVDNRRLSIALREGFHAVRQVVVAGFEWRCCLSDVEGDLGPSEVVGEESAVD